MYNWGKTLNLTLLIMYACLKGLGVQAHYANLHFISKLFFFSFFLHRLRNRQVQIGFSLRPGV